MRFDDRLLTVLNQPAEDRHDAAVRWRQLVDLVARCGADYPSPVVDQALEAITAEAPNVDEPLRAAAARSVAALPLPLGLLEYFAADALSVSAPVLAAATLDPRQWSVLRSIADEETRLFIDALHPDLAGGPRVEPSRPQLRQSLPEERPQSPPQGGYAAPSLHEVVERIEQRRRMRSGAATPAVAPPASEEAGSLFRWECRPTGEITWVDGAPRGALIGRSIAKPLDSTGDRVDQEVVRAFANRVPFRDALLKISSSTLVAGEWKISGIPAFDPVDGRFAGYRGVALREERGRAEASREPPTELIADPDSLRELVHEIKTPLNAIIGFAEIIERQYLGPADRGYRHRAGEIVRQARLLLTAIDDVDFAAKVHSAGGARERVDLSALVARKADDLREMGQKWRITVDAVQGHRQVLARVQGDLAERLLFRLAAALADLAEPGERLEIGSDLIGGSARMTFTRPGAIRGLSESQLFGDEAASENARSSFMLRLVRRLTRIAGGDVVVSSGGLALAFPVG